MTAAPARRSNSASFAVVGLAIVALVAILILGRGTSKPETVTNRADRIAAEIRCPTCQGLSVKDSKAAGARAIYSEIERQVETGERDEEIRAYLVDRFGTSELLRPRATGIGSIVWIAPIAFTVVAFAGLVRVFLRRRPSPRHATDADRTMVKAALAATSMQPGPTGPTGPVTPRGGEF